MVSQLVWASQVLKEINQAGINKFTFEIKRKKGTQKFASFFASFFGRKILNLRLKKDVNYII